MLQKLNIIICYVLVVIVHLCCRSIHSPEPRRSTVPTCASHNYVRGTYIHRQAAWPNKHDRIKHDPSTRTSQQPSHESTLYIQRVCNYPLLHRFVCPVSPSWILDGTLKSWPVVKSLTTVRGLPKSWGNLDSTLINSLPPKVAAIWTQPQLLVRIWYVTVFRLVMATPVLTSAVHSKKSRVIIKSIGSHVKKHVVAGTSVGCSTANESRERHDHCGRSATAVVYL